MLAAVGVKIRPALQRWTGSGKLQPRRGQVWQCQHIQYPNYLHEPEPHAQINLLCASTTAINHNTQYMNVSP